jgi:hypothetical protein
LFLKNKIKTFALYVANVLIDADMTAKVSDFGLAKTKVNQLISVLKKKAC